MSQENVELVRGLQPAPDVDVAALFRDRAAWAALMETVAPLMHEDFKAGVRTGFDAEPQFVSGPDGLRSVWLDWLEPWESYRTEITDVIEVDDERVLVLSRDYGRSAGSNSEVRLFGSGLWTVLDGKVAAAEFMTRDDALKAVGLAE
jgi:SnoaL-like domain